jgi:hypothetical protein
MPISPVPSSTAVAVTGITPPPMPVLPIPLTTVTVSGVPSRPAVGGIDPSAAHPSAAPESHAAAEGAPLPAQRASQAGTQSASSANASQAETQTSDPAETITDITGSLSSPAAAVIAQSSAIASALAATINAPAPGMATDFMADLTSSAKASAPKAADAAAPAASSGASSGGAGTGTVKSTPASSAAATVTTAAPSGQHTAGDANTGATAAAKPVEASASMSTAAPTGMQHVAATSTSVPQTVTKPAGDVPHAGELPHSAEAGESAAASGINTARVIQSMGETEMHVGLRSAEFGDISIRTAVSQQQMLAQISVDRSDLGSAIAAHIPELQAKFGNEYGLHASVEVTQSGTSFAGNGNQSAPHQQKSFAQAVAVEHAATNSEMDNQSVRAAADGARRLDIQA